MENNNPESELYSEKLPWPEPGDKLFQTNPDSWWANLLSREGAIVYSTGYKRAADILVKHIARDDREVGFLVFPVVFLYRQYLELQLKEIIRDGQRLFDENEDVPTHHDIGLLWKGARRIIQKMWPKENTKDLDVIDSNISEFVRIDPYATAFRYPTDKKGNPSLSGRDQIDLKNFSDVIDKISSLLEGSHSGIIDALDIKGDLERQYRNDYGY